jgi:hypothetical protein
MNVVEASNISPSLVHPELLLAPLGKEAKIEPLYDRSAREEDTPVKVLDDVCMFAAVLPEENTTLVNKLSIAGGKVPLEVLFRTHDSQACMNPTRNISNSNRSPQTARVSSKAALRPPLAP